MALNGAEERRRFLLAVQFLTRLPVAPDYSPEGLAASPRYYPAVGLLVGGIAALVFAGAAAIWPPAVAAVLALGASALVTGGLHEDGLSDTCDGLGGGRNRERMLEIMRDSRIGSHGALGLLLVTLGKIAALTALPPAAAPWALVAAHAGGRASMLWVMQVLSYARPQGAGSGVTDLLDAEGRMIAGATLALAALPLLFVLPVTALILGGLGLALGHIALRRRVQRALGGWTGDTLGAVEQAGEAGVLLGLAAFLA